MEARADVAIIGGSGLYALLDDATEHRVATPFGPPSDPIVIGDVAGRPTAFLPRHGHDHRFPPHRIPYRANLWALRSLGVRQILAPCAVGSLRAELGPGTLVVPDQVVDRTRRAQTFHDRNAVHVSFADPYCPVGRAAFLEKAAADTDGDGAVDGGTMVITEGPRFASRAESQFHAAQGWSLVNMTGLPEASLARELAVCYTAIALVTDHDAGIDADSSVTQDEVFRVFGENLDRLRALLLDTVPTLPSERTCLCAHALDDLPVAFSLP